MSPKGWAALGTVAAAAFACARPYPPPGGEPDEQPPRVISITPEPLRVGVAPDARVRIRFDERISERGVEDAVLVSPLTSELRVERGRSELRVSLRGGWEPDRVYHVTVQPVIQDLFQNTIAQPLEIVFSTGPGIPQTAVAGLVEDRLTGTAAPGAWILAVREADSTSYAAVTDTAGLFALRHLPPGAYRIRAFMDHNRNRDADFREEQDSAMVRLAEGDTAVLSLALLPGDTTRAHVIRAEARDSLHVLVHLDDHVDPRKGLGEVTAALRLLPDSTEWPIARLLLPHEYEAEQRALRAAADSAMPDSLAAVAAGRVAAADTAAAAPQAVQRRGAIPAPQPRERGAPRDSAAPPLPVREIVLVPAAPLRPSARYLVELGRVVNINGVPGGGGSAEFAAPEPPAPDTARAGAARDTVPPDTSRAPPDTIPPDTAGAPRGSRR